MPKGNVIKRPKSNASGGRSMLRESSSGRPLTAPTGKPAASGKAKKVIKNSAKRHSAALIRLADR